MNNPKAYEKIWFHLGIISIPFLSFTNTNIHDLDFVLIKSIFFIFLIACLLIITLSKIVSFFLKKITFNSINFLISSVFFLSFFLYTIFRDIFHYVAPIYKGNISFLLIILTFTIFYYLLFKVKNNLVIKFVIIYFSISFVFNFGVFIINSKKIITHGNHSPNILFSKDEIKNINSNDKKNIYYIIVDGALPLQIFDKTFKTNYYFNYNDEISESGYSFVENVKSSYQQTKYTFASILNLSYYINENNYRSISTSSSLYPSILSERNYRGLPLIRTLSEIGYKFKWVGTFNKNCKLYNTSLCLESKVKEQYNLISYYVLNTFLDRSPLIPIYSRITNLFNSADENSNFDFEYVHKENDGIKKFLNKIKSYNSKNEPHMYFIHHGPPHNPHIYNSDCSIDKKREISGIGYKKNYECMLKRIMELIKYIETNDRNSVVIIQSDHGIKHDTFPEINTKPLFSTYDIFTLIKVNQECKEFISDKINQPNAIRLALSCATGQKVKLLEKKMYFVDFEIGNASVGGLFLLKEIKTFDDEISIKFKTH